MRVALTAGDRLELEQSGRVRSCWRSGRRRPAWKGVGWPGWGEARSGAGSRSARSVSARSKARPSVFDLNRQAHGIRLEQSEGAPDRNRGRVLLPEL